MMKRRTLVLLAAIGFLAAPDVTRAAEIGSEDFKNRCARCHSVDKAVSYMKAHQDAKERAIWLERKLARHHARDAAQRKRIIQFLEEAFNAKK